MAMKTRQEFTDEFKREAVVALRGNTPVGSVFGSLKTELDSDGPFDTGQAARTTCPP